jgi:acyl-CoA thioesterase-1
MRKRSHGNGTPLLSVAAENHAFKLRVLVIKHVCKRGAALLFLCMPSTVVATPDAFVAVDRALAPIWTCGRVHETVMFQSAQSGPPIATTAFLPSGPIKITTGSVTYKEGKDYLIDHDLGRITLTPTSRIPFLLKNNLLTQGDKKSIFFRALSEPSLDLVFNEGHFFADNQVNISYEHPLLETQNKYPQYAGATLIETSKRLLARKPISILLMGDSISEGYNASAFIGFPPYTPSYPTLVVESLRRVFGGHVVLDNRSHAGWRADQGLAQINDEKLLDKRPDLVIFAYGMNDALSISPQTFGKTIARMIASFRHVSPQTEFLLISPMLPNPDWAIAFPSRFFELRDELAHIEAPGVALVDMTSIWATLLERKSFYDLTGNGVNHPNDFGHSLYAQAIISTIVPAHRLQLSAPIKCRMPKQAPTSTR